MLDNDEKIWRILYAVAMQSFDDTIDFFERENRRCLAFTATSEALGVYNRVIYISEDGYFATNIFDYEYSYLLEKRQQDRSSVMYKNIPRKQVQYQSANHIRNCYRNRKWIYYG